MFGRAAMTENQVTAAKKITCKLFSIPGFIYRPEDVIEHFIRELPKPEIPYEQAGLYRELVGLE
jgi:hypothetical protein